MFNDMLAGGEGDELEVAAELQTSALQPPHKYVPWVSLPLTMHSQSLCPDLWQPVALLQRSLCSTWLVPG